MEALVAVLFLLVVAGGTLAFMVGLPITAGVVWLASTVDTLSRRVRDLEVRLADLQAAPAPTPAPIPEPAREEDGEPLTEEIPVEPEPPTEEIDLGPPKPQKPPFTLPSPERVVMWLAAALGGTTLVLALLLGLAVVIERGWLGPAVRVCGGLTFGTGLWGVGILLRRRVPVLGASLSGVAIATLYGTLFAAHGLYHLLPSGLVFGAMVAVTAVATATAARDGDRFTAHLALLGGLLTPVLVSSGENRPVALFGYLAVLLGGVLWAARRKDWWDVTAVAAVGAAGLHLGWSVSWWAADQVPFALGGLLALTVPFAVAATAKPMPVRIVGFVAAIVLPALALPWIVPVDPMFTDPRSYLEVVRPLGGAAWWAAAGVVVLLAPAWLASRSHAHPIGSLLASLGAVGLLLVGTGAWLNHPEPPVPPLVVLAVGPLVVGVLALAFTKHAAGGLLPLPLASGLALALVAGVAPEGAGPAFGLAACGLAVFGALGARPPRAGAVLLCTVFGAALALWIASVWLDGTDRSWVAGPAVLSLALLGVLPLAGTWHGGSRLPWAAAALAWAALFPALHVLWRETLGEAAIGLLPLLLGAGALLGAVTLVRRYRVHTGDLALALFVAVALLGATSAVAVQLREEWLTVTWALEAAVLGLLARRLTHPLVRVAAVLLGVTVAVRLVLNPFALSYGDAAGWPILNWTLYTWGVPFLALLALANGMPRKGDWLDWAKPVLRVLALFVGFALVEVEVAHAFRDAGPVELGGHGLWQGMARSMAWAGYGLAVLVAGLITGRREVRFIGFSFILLATAKVFVVDLWSLSGFVRVASVGALGASLLVAAFLFERLVLRDTSREEPSS